MANILALDLGLISSDLEQMGKLTLNLAESVSTSMTLDLDSGRSDINLDLARDIATKKMPDAMLDPFLSALTDITTGGFAMFGSSGAIERTTGFVIPWVVITDLAFRLQGAPEAMRSALGLEEGISETEVMEHLRRNFRSVPDWLDDPVLTQLLVRNPVALPGDGWEGKGGADPEEQPKKPSGNTSVGKVVFDGIVAPSIDLALEVASCLIKNGDWGPLGGHTWGWAFGWQVCIDQDCADKLAKLLMDLGGGAALLKAIQQVLSAGGVAAGIAALSLTAGAALAIYGFLLGVNVKAVNWSRGVCIQGNWPVIGGPGAFVWAAAGS